MNKLFNEYLRGVAVQITSIILAGVGAALIAFIGTIATQTGACNLPQTDPQNVGLLGAILKGAHSSIALAIKK